MNMFNVTLRGTHYEIGKQYGRLLKSQGTKFPRLEDTAILFAAKVEEKIGPIVPELIDEIQGIADGSRLDYEIVRTYALTLGRSPSCTVCAISSQYTSDRSTIFARNYDATPAFHAFILYRTYPKKHYAHMGCCFDLLVGREDGLNEAGVAIAVAGVHGIYTDAPGVWDHIPVRAVLDHCSTVDEAVTLLLKFPHFWTKNFLVADAHGNIAIIEAAQQDIAVHYPQDGIGIITNHFNSPSMQPYNNPNRTMPRTHDRLHLIDDWFQQQTNPIRSDQIKRILKNPKTGICSNTTETPTQDAFLTIWSWVAKLGSRSFEMATGKPITSTSRYRRYSF
jgi:predicted choloylglycine hydrolase